MEKTTTDRKTLTLLEEADAILEDGLRRIGVAVRGDPTAKDQAVASMITRVVTVRSELRKSAKEERNEISGISTAQVMLYLRQLGPADRAALLREAARIGQEGSVLG